MANGACGPSATGELVFDNVKVPKENLLPNVKGLKGPPRLSDKGPLWHRLGVVGAGDGLL